MGGRSGGHVHFTTYPFIHAHCVPIDIGHTSKHIFDVGYYACTQDKRHASKDIPNDNQILSCVANDVGYLFHSDILAQTTRQGRPFCSQAKSGTQDIEQATADHEGINATSSTHTDHVCPAPGPTLFRNPPSRSFLLTSVLHNIDKTSTSMHNSALSHREHQMPDHNHDDHQQNTGTRSQTMPGGKAPMWDDGALRGQKGAASQRGSQAVAPPSRSKQPSAIGTRVTSKAAASLDLLLLLGSDYKEEEEEEVNQ